MSMGSIRLGLAILLGAAGGVFAACDDGAGPCVDGEACVCSDDCTEDCEGGDCGFECRDGASCSFSCPQGGCSVDCTNAASCELECPGGECSMQCVGTDRCELFECDTDCPLVCGGATQCSNSCDLEAGCPTTP